MMTTKEIRDAIIEQRTISANITKQAEDGCMELKKILNSITEEMRREISAFGLDIDSLQDVDFDRLKTDAEYNKDYKQRFSRFTSELNDKLEKEVSRW